jgi:hypothetical protein
MTKKVKVSSLEDEFFLKKEKKPSKFAQFFFPKSKPTTSMSKIELPKKPLNLLNRPPASFNLGLTYIMLAILCFVMVLSNNIAFWLIGIPTIYAFYRHIKLEKKRTGNNE